MSVDEQGFLQKAKVFLYRLWRDSTVAVRRARYASAARNLVTPFSGFVLSDFYLSSEIKASRLGYLNRRAKDLSEGARPTKDGTVFFVQVDQLEEFAADILPGMKNSFVLVTGKWHLPALERSNAVSEIASSSRVLRWYSQNQVFPDLPIMPFPFGIELTTAPLVRRLRRKKSVQKSIELSIPHVRIHPHFSYEIRRIRGALTPLMEPEMPVIDYLKLIQKCSFVISPPGDRPDTYRHWESIALGAVPVGNVTGPLRTMFGESMVVVENVESIDAGSLPIDVRPDDSLVLLDTWRQELHSAAQISRA